MRYAFIIGAAFLFLAGGLVAMAYESAYEPTPVGKIAVKTLPAARAIASKMEPKAENMDPSFMPLFRYIQSNNIPMTIPVEADREDKAAMRFFIGQSQSNRVFASTANVAVLDLPRRTVVSIGMRGSYTRKRYEEGVRQLREWLKANPPWVADGEPSAVYWNGPFVPFFLKKSEVHIPVRKATGP